MKLQLRQSKVSNFVAETKKKTMLLAATITFDPWKALLSLQSSIT
jgi:hypothetical protein